MAKPLRRLQGEGAWFARAREVRLLWVQADGASRGLALSFVEQLEFHADNTSPFIVLDAPWAGGDNGAAARAARFNQLFSEKRRALVDAGLDVGEFSPSGPPDGRLDAFGADLRRACAALRPPLSGLVLVLAPPRVEAPEAFVSDVRALLEAPSLAATRWIVIEAGSEHLGGLVLELGGRRALAVDARIDPADQRRDLAALAGPAPARDAPLVAPHPWGAWSSGGAMPAVAPPRRLNDPPAPSDEQLEGAGLSPLYLKGGAQRIRGLVLGASVALGEQRTGDALDLQARAAELFGDMNMTDEQVTALLVHGGYALAATRSDAARGSYEQAAALAERAKLPGAQARAELALGMLDALEQRPSALGHYVSAATLSEAAGAPALAIECWRLAGQLAAEGGLPGDADQHWQRAVDLAEALPPGAARATSAAEAARLLAHAAEGRGEPGRSAELHRRAFRIEHGVEPGPPLTEPAERVEMS